MATLRRQEREVMYQSLAIEKREKDLEYFNTINIQNKSIEVEQKRLLKDF